MYYNIECFMKYKNAGKYDDYIDSLLRGTNIKSSPREANSKI